MRTDIRGRWNVRWSFGSVQDAKAGLAEWHKLTNISPARDDFRIVDHHGDEHSRMIRGSWQDQSHPAGGKGALTKMPDIELEKPLNLKRSAVISKLQENFDKEKKEREDAEQKEKDARAEFETFVSNHMDQVVNYLRSHHSGAGTSWKGTLEAFEETFEGESFATKETKPGRLETELEKLVRVLGMSGDDTIQVKPTQRVYDLL